MKKLIFLSVLALVFGIIGTANVVSQPCLSDADGDGDVDGFDFQILKGEYFRADCDPYVRLQKTGQTTSYRTGDDGDEEAGVSHPNPRFTDNSDGTVTDNLTGLIWLEQANYNSTGGGTGTATWNDAIDFCKALGSGMCGLTDGSSAGDWRLPNIKELLSLVHNGYYDPALPNTAGTGKWTAGDPFTNVQNNYYWSSTTYPGLTTWAFDLYLSYGFVSDYQKVNQEYVWPVRDPN